MKKIFTLFILVWAVNAASFAQKAPLYPTDIKLTTNGKVVLTEKGTKSVAIYSQDGKLIQSIALSQTPTSLTILDNKAYVTTFDNKGEVQIIDIETGNIDKTIEAGSGATGIILSNNGKKAYVCNQYAGTISEIDFVSGKQTRIAQALREPKNCIISKDNKYLFCTNFLPQQRADLDVVASAVSVIDLNTFKKIKDIPLENGSNALRGMCITPDGKYIYVSHNLGRFQVPTSQLQQGWMNTSAFSIIDVASQKFLGAVLVDESDRGAAGIWGIACNDDKLFISHSGTHEISVIDHKAMLKKFEDYADKTSLNYDLNFLYGLRTRIKADGNGPQNMVLKDNKLFFCTYYSDILNILNTENNAITAVNLNVGRTESSIDKGERFFNDAAYCFQNWQSCNGCHPDARTDGMNWDLMNDGVGNSKNCKSMLFAHVTPPSMISGIRLQAEIAVRKGFEFIQFSAISEEDAKCVDDYLKALKPVPSPYLVNGQLSEKAQEGRKVFEKLKCDECHSGPYYTDMKMHRIGDDIEFEKGWDTPTLRECWRTAPYLFDGRAATMRDVFETHKHGIDKKVSDKDIDALVEYVNSL